MRNPFYVSANCQWPEWFSRKMNWRNFDLIRCSFEYADYCYGRVEINLALLGFTLYVEWRPKRFDDLIENLDSESEGD